MDKKQKSSIHGPSTGEIALEFPTSIALLIYEKGFNRERELNWKLIGKRYKEGSVVERICKLHS